MTRYWRDSLPKLFVGVGLVRVVGVFLAFAVIVVLARVLGPAEYGVYATVMALVYLVNVPVQSGLPNLVIRETARLQQEENWSLIGGLWQWSLIAVGGSTLLVLLVIGGSFVLLPDLIPAGRISPLLWGFAVIPFAAWTSLRGAMLTGLRKPVLGQVPETILRPAFLLLIIFVAMIWMPLLEARSIDAMAVTAVSALLSMLAATLILRIHRPAETMHAGASYAHRAWLGALWPLSLIAGAHVINRHTDVLMLALFDSAENVGAYRVSSQLAMFASFSLQIVNAVVAPRFARLHARADREELQRLVTSSARLVLLTAVPVALLLLLFGSTLLTLFFGSEYATGNTALSILTIGQLANAGAGSVGILLNMSGLEKQTAKGILIGSLANIVLNLALIPPFSMNGAATATALSTVLWNLILWRIVRRRLGLESTAFAITRRIAKS